MAEHKNQINNISNNIAGKKHYYHKYKHVSDYNINIERLVNTEASCPEIIERNPEFESTTKFIGKNYNSVKLTEEVEITSKLRSKPLLKDLM